MGEDGASGKDWLRARGITCVLQTQFSSCFFFFFFFFCRQNTGIYIYVSLLDLTGDHISPHSVFPRTVLPVKLYNCMGVVGTWGRGRRATMQKHMKIFP